MKVSKRMANPSELATEGFPEEGRIAAVDFGTVRIGLAVCDPDRILASPLEVHRAGSPEADANYFRQVAADQQLVGWIVGFPIHCDGGESEKSIQCRRFAVWLQEETGFPVRLFDERFTTVAATQRLAMGKSTRKKKTQRLDAVAAQVILESFIESCRYHGDVAGFPAKSPARGASPLQD
ncbi:MAG: Holliday junction resolvase RuvX [Planctomycetota bacterium]